MTALQAIAIGIFFFVVAVPLRLEAKIDVVTINVDGTRVNFKVPPGQCLVDGKYPVDRWYLQQLKNMNKSSGELQVVFADYLGLGGWRMGLQKPMPTYSLVIKPHTQSQVNESRCVPYERPSYSSVIEAVNAMKSVLRQQEGSPAIKGYSYFGVVRSSASGCFHGHMHHGVNALGQSVVALTVTVHTKLNGQYFVFGQTCQRTDCPSDESILDNAETWVVDTARLN